MVTAHDLKQKIPADLPCITSEINDRRSRIIHAVGQSNEAYLNPEPCNPHAPVLE